ncbi:MAG: hypothetical protein MJA31_08565 [Clostridia bacterium]|nr:hypothetical protein [Clostridia bacterium]
MKNSKLISTNYILGLLFCSLFALLMIFFSQDALEASKFGIALWFNAVLPALFPFFVCSKLMIKMGIHKIVGRLLEPIMRPLFKVPGEASFVFTISVTSGYPLGTQIIADLREKKSITKIEAERMLSFCSTSGPLFMLGTVGVGMFGSSLLGWSIALSHFFGALLNGLLFRFYGKSIKRQKIKRTSLRDVLYDAEKGFNNQVSFMTHFGESIMESFKTLLVICGYIILFSIIITLFDKFMFFNMMALSLFKAFDYNVVVASLKGFFEITLGCNALSSISYLNFTISCILCSAIISWSGLSIHAQSLTFIARTDIKKSIYFFSKVTHSICSSICALFIAPLLIKYQPQALTAFSISDKIQNSNFVYKLLFSTQLMLIVFIIFIITAVISHVFNSRS